MANPSIYAAFERMWQHIVLALGGKADKTDIVQSDMSQNDESAPDYVKGRTHWVEEDFIVAEQTISGFSVMGGSIYAVQNPFSFTPMLGHTYTITWDGDSYDCIAYANEYGLIYLGNENYIDMMSGGDIPFSIVDSGEVVFVITESTADSHIISILGEKVYQLDPKYLPAATESSRGGVVFGAGKNRAARVINTFFNATQSEFEEVYELYRNGGVVWRIVNDTVVAHTGDLSTGVCLTLSRSEPSLVIAKVDADGNFSMERGYSDNVVLGKTATVGQVVAVQSVDEKGRAISYEAKTVAEAEHTHEVATTSANGLMPSEDKAKVDTLPATLADTIYTTARYRASSLHSAETTPTTNGVIAWMYE